MTVSDEQKLYPERDAAELGDYYMRHIDHMTTEELWGKGDIAAQLAWRDREIDELRQSLVEIEVECREEWKQAAHWRQRAEQAEAKLALTEQDASGYRWIVRRPNATITQFFAVNVGSPQWLSMVT